MLEPQPAITFTRQPAARPQARCSGDARARQRRQFAGRAARHQSGAPFAHLPGAEIPIGALIQRFVAENRHQSRIDPLNMAVSFTPCSRSLHEWRGVRSGLGKEGGVILSSMVKAASSFLVLGIAAGALAQSSSPAPLVVAGQYGQAVPRRAALMRRSRGSLALGGAAPVGQPALLVLFVLPDQLSRLAGRGGDAAQRRGAAVGRGGQSARRDPPFRAAPRQPLRAAMPSWRCPARHRAARQALAEAREAWRGGVMPQADEARLLGAFAGGLDAAGPRPANRRVALEWRPDQRRAADGLCLAGTAAGVRSAARDAESLRRRGDAPLRPRQCGRAGRRSAARPGQLDARPMAMPMAPAPARPAARADSRPANPERFMEALVAQARAAATDRQWTFAWQIASQVDDIFPPGTDVSTRSYGERDEYTNLTWLAGQAALNWGATPTRRRCSSARARRAKPQTRAKGFYWAARAVGERDARADPLARAGGVEPGPVLRPARARAARPRATAAAAGDAAQLDRAHRLRRPAARRGDPLSRHGRPARRPDFVRPRPRPEPAQ